MGYIRPIPKLQGNNEHPNKSTIKFPLIEYYYVPGYLRFASPHFFASSLSLFLFFLWVAVSVYVYFILY